MIIPHELMQNVENLYLFEVRLNTDGSRSCFTSGLRQLTVRECNESVRCSDDHSFAIAQPYPLLRFDPNDVKSIHRVLAVS